MLSHAGESVNRCRSRSVSRLVRRLAARLVGRAVRGCGHAAGGEHRLMSDYIEASLQIILNDPNKI